MYRPSLLDIDINFLMKTIEEPQKFSRVFGCVVKMDLLLYGYEVSQSSHRHIGLTVIYFIIQQYIDKRMHYYIKETKVIKKY